MISSSVVLVAVVDLGISMLEGSKDEMDSRAALLLLAVLVVLRFRLGRVDFSILEVAIEGQKDVWEK